MLSGRHILVGVTGSIAAYKSALLVRELRKAGADVRVVMTEAATRFLAPLTLATLSESEVVLDMFPADSSKGTWHIHLGLWADAMLIAPASANTLARIAHGFADSALTSLVLALRCPLVVAPAMDTDMWLHPATQGNIRILRERGVHVIPPESGELASGLVGPGRLPEIPTLLDGLDAVLSGRGQDWQGRSLVVTAGPTHEAVDPVRFLGNRSSGKMGFAIAEAAAQRGATVTLIAGPVRLATPSGVTRVDVTSAAEMLSAVDSAFTTATDLVMAAAVADYTPVDPSSHKRKKDAWGEAPVIALTRTPDILRTMAARKENRLVVGFALETEDLLVQARKKLRDKGVDLIVANDAMESGSGFDTDTNHVVLLFADGREEDLPLSSKRELADVILDRMHALKGGKHE